MSKIVILGLDGATFDLLDPWMEQGLLPHCARLVGEGARATLLSTIPPMSPQAWSTFQTGVNPGKHGVYQFMESDLHIPTTPVTSSSLRVPPFWKFFSNAGWRVGIVNVFATYPPQPVNGFVIAGRNVPSGKPYMFPPGLSEEVRNHIGRYIIDVDPYHAEESLRDISEGEFLALLHEMVETRIRTVRYLQDTHSPDLLVVVFTVTDMVQHFFWHYLDPSHPAHPGSGETDAHTAILDVYRILDGFVGEVLDRMEPSDTLMVVSDHGFGPWYKELNLNRWLIENGWMKLRSSNRPSRLLKDWAKRLLPDSLLHPLLRTYSQHRRRRSAYEEKPIEWSQTKAFAHGHYGNIYLNVKGREPLGIVAPGEEYEHVRDAICRGLEEWTNPATGQPAVKRAWRKEELYHGPYADRAPDIVVEWADYAYVGSRATNYREPIIHDVHCFYHNLIQSGSHRREGVLLLKGPGVRTNYVGSAAQIQDIAPTVLYLGGQPVPSYMDGQVLIDLLEPQFVENHPPRSVYTDLPSHSTTPKRALTSREAEEIIERLKGLGYLE